GSAQNRKQLRRDSTSIDVLWLAGRAHGSAAVGPGSTLFERTTLALTIEEVEIRETPSVSKLLGLEVERDQASGVWIRQRLQQNAASHGEHNRSSAGTERQNEDREQRKARSGPQTAPCVTNIL